MPTANQNPEQIARDQIDKRLAEAAWHVQNMKDLDWSAGLGVAVREYQTDTGPADHVLFVNLSGTMATFPVSTWQARQQLPQVTKASS